MNAISAPPLQSAPVAALKAAAPALPESASAPRAAPVQAPATAAPRQAQNPNAAADKATPSLQQAREMAAQMQQRMSSVAPDLEFAVDKESGKALIKVIDRSTQEVVWQIPSEEMLQVTRALDRFQEGMMLRRTA